MATMTRVLATLVLGLCLSCASRGTLTGGGGLRLPEPAETYQTSARPNGVIGGDKALEVERTVTARLEQRGDEAEPDGALSSVALWFLDELYAGRVPASAEASRAALRFGFVGTVLGAQGFSTSNADAGVLDAIFQQLPQNYRVTRYGIATGKNGADIAVVFGSVEASLADIPREVEPGAKIRLAGHVERHYQRASVFVTDTAGAVRELKMPSRDIDTTVELRDRGIYKLEVMGYGKDGPVVLVNVPVQVGPSLARERRSNDAPMDPATTPAQAEARMLELLNEQRRKIGLGPLFADAELRNVALGHSTDMSEHGFVGHVSPTTGSPEDRARAAGLRVARLGECVAAEQSPDAAHEGLMESPSHRGAMLDPLFTHVGIGVSFRDLPSGKQLIATLVLARRPAAEEARQNAESITRAIQALRQQRALPALRSDPGLNRVAQSAIKGYLSKSPPSQEGAASAASRALQVEVNRLRRTLATCTSIIEILDRTQLADVPLLLNPLASDLGVGVAPIDDAQGPRLAIFLVATAAAGKKDIECR
jgi:uncharacterized protein YkwD